MEIRNLAKKDYKKAVQFAIRGMHFDWYMSNRTILNLYGRYFLYMELNKATQVLAADVDSGRKGVGSFLLEELEKRENGKELFLYTDNACTYQFYEHRGFERFAERHIELQLEQTVPLQCYLYRKRIITGRKN